MTTQSVVPTSSSGWIHIVALLAQREHDRHEVVSGLRTPIEVCPDPFCVAYRHQEAERLT